MKRTGRLLATLPKFPSDRAGHAASPLPNGHLLVMGGEWTGPFTAPSTDTDERHHDNLQVNRILWLDDRARFRLTAVHGDCFKLDLLSMEWTRLSSCCARGLQMERSWHGMISLLSSSVLMFGGSNFSHRMDDLYMFDGCRWRSVGQGGLDRPCGRSSHSMTSIGRTDHFAVIGGGRDVRNGVDPHSFLLNDVYVGYLSAGGENDIVEWRRVPSSGVELPHMWGHSCVSMGRGDGDEDSRLVIWGGQLASGWNSRMFIGKWSSPMCRGSIEWFNPVVSTTSLQPCGRHGHSCDRLSDTQLVMFGGWGRPSDGGDSSGDECKLNDLWLCSSSDNFASISWQQVQLDGYIPRPRCGHVSTLFHGELVVFGGRGGGDLLLVDGSTQVGEDQHLNDCFSVRLAPSSLFILCLRAVAAYRLSSLGSREFDGLTRRIQSHLGRFQTDPIQT